MGSAFTDFLSSLGARLGPVDAIIFLIGLAFGSFGGMLASRVPRKLAPTGRSQCPHCGAVLSPSELIPVVSILIQSGRCKHCGERISGGYLLVELSTAVTFVLFYRYFGLGIVGIINLILALHFTVLAGTDMMYGLLPNRIIASGLLFALLLRIVEPLQAASGIMAGGLSTGSGSASAGIGGSGLGGGLLVYIWPSLRDGLFGAALGFGFFFLIALVKSGAMGGGDIKMAALIGLYLGAWRLFPALGLGFILSSLYSVPLMIAGKLKRTDTLPLGIFLSLATIAMALAKF